jgi:hypothetical protein
MAGVSSEGGAPLGSLLYCPIAALAANVKHKMNLCIRAQNHCRLRRVKGSIGAGDGIRTRDIDLGKVALYQLSYSRSIEKPSFSFTCNASVKPAIHWMRRRTETFRSKGFIILFSTRAFVLDCLFRWVVTAGGIADIFPSILDRA